MGKVKDVIEVPGIVIVLRLAVHKQPDGWNLEGALKLPASHAAKSLAVWQNAS